MATTGFWPVKTSLKDVIEYANNPKKTIGNELFNALDYASDDKKTDQKMFVSAINCNVKRAYEQMVATKKRFGKTGGNVAYHGYQSFVAGEVTADEAHNIGMETARKMWGDDYEIVVTTHLNTDNLHNHIIVNSVSFKTGKKFANHISDHYKLREISDEVCRSRGKSVLESSSFYGRSKGERRAQMSGVPTHREMLRRDVERCLSVSSTPKDFEQSLKDLGYIFTREGKTLSVRAPDWKRSVRLSSLGYSTDIINERMKNNHEKRISYFYVKRRNYTPLLSFEAEMKKAGRMGGVQLTFALVIELCRLISGGNIQPDIPKPLSPTVRQEVKNLNKIMKQYMLLCNNNIDSREQLSDFVRQKQGDISALESERQGVYNRLRREKSEDKRVALKAQARAISAKLKPLRAELKSADEIAKSIAKYENLLSVERLMEQKIREKNRSER